MPLLRRLPDFAQLARLDRPIGIYLLLWPTLSALVLAAQGWPSAKNLVIFTLGVVVMRSAGCVINDYADRHIDGAVERTRGRPLVTGRVSEREALAFFALLILLALLLVLATNLLTLSMAVIGAMLAIIYPFTKRFTQLPQLVLGAAFSWGIPMAYAAERNQLDDTALLLFLANWLWTVAYDTEYAMVDRDDDLTIGVKSTAILFGRADRLIIGLLQVATVGTLALIGIQAQELPWPYFVGLTAAAGLFVYQQWLIRKRDRDACFKAFKNNHYVGAAVFLGVAAALLG